MTYTKLLVSWKGPKTKYNYLVGVLEKLGKGYKFNYNANEVIKAKEEGFMPFIGLSDTHKEYRSEKLFPVFERRLPHKTRAVFKKFIEERNLDTSDDVNWNYLSIIGGRLATDSLSFQTPITFFNGAVSYTFEVAGWSYTKGNNRSLHMHDQLLLQIDENNPKDKYAVELIDPEHSQQRVGYIPRPFNQLFYKLIANQTSLNAAIVGIVGEDARPVVFIASNGSQIDLTNYKELLYLIDKRSNEISYKNNSSTS